MAEFTVNSSRLDPYVSYKFRIKFDDEYVAGVSKISAIRRSTEVITHRDGADPSHPHLTPGQTKFDPITLERGVTHDTEFERWANKVWYYPNSNSISGDGTKQRSLADFRKDIIIDVFNEAGQKVISYNVYRCWVSNFQSFPDLDASANSIAIQTLELQNEGWDRVVETEEPEEPTYDEPAQ